MLALTLYAGERVPVWVCALVSFFEGELLQEMLNLPPVKRCSESLFPSIGTVLFKNNLLHFLSNVLILLHPDRKVQRGICFYGDLEEAITNLGPHSDMYDPGD